MLDQSTYVQRTRTLGLRADFCDGCLHVTRHEVLSREEAQQTFGFGGKFEEVDRLVQCMVCGTTNGAAAFQQFVDDPRLPFAELIQRTNPDLTDQRLDEIEALVERNFTPQEREWHILDAFFRNQVEEINRAETSAAFWLGTLFVVCTVTTLLTFALADYRIGVAVMVALTAVFVIGRRKILGHAASQTILPRLRSFLKLTGKTLGDLQAHLESDRFHYPRLARHLKMGQYRELREVRHPALAEGRRF